MNKIVIFVNGEKHELDSDQVKVGTLIELGGGNITEYELQERQGNNGPIVKTFTDPEEVITIQNGTHFLTHLTGPVIPA